MGILVVCLIYFGYRAERTDQILESLERRQADFLAGAVRWRDEVEAAENQSLFFSSKLLEAQASLLQKDRRIREMREERESRSPRSREPLCEERQREVDGRLEKIAAEIAALRVEMEKQGKASAAVVAQSGAQLKELQADLEQLRKAAAGTADSALLAKIEEDLQAQTAVLEKNAQEFAGLKARSEEAKASLGELARRLQGLDARLAETRAELSALGEERLVARGSPEPAGGTAGQPAGGNGEPARRLEIPVVAIQGNIIALRGGEASGLRPGLIFEVSRDGRRLAQIRVVHVKNELSGAEVLHLTPGERIEKGDLARLVVEPEEREEKKDGVDPPS